MTMDPEAAAKLQAIAERESDEKALPSYEEYQKAQVEETPAEETAPKAKTEPQYAVFRVQGEENTDAGPPLRLSLIAGSVKASNDIKAITEAVDPAELSANAARYVAIPHRSLRIRTVGVVSEPRVVVS